MARPVYVVHGVDTEGPLHESVEATFERLAAIFGMDLEPSVGLLGRLQAGTHVLEIRSETPTFGPQPWLALRTVAGTYHDDNLDIDEPFHRWRYVFDEETFPLGALDAIGLAANNANGVTTVVNLDPATGTASRRVLHEPSAAVATAHGS